jgi:4-amino-4-deoxy-L-arabinose transferase-like glycosyltransferase
MTTADFLRLAHNPFERLFEALVDPGRRERAIVLLLVGYAATWTVYAIIAKGSQDVHYDMGELVAWSREVGFSTPKHPPLGAWLVRVWFSVFPLEDWAYYLLAVIWAAVALWITWHISARYLSPDKRALGIMLLTFVPFYNFHALKFNANTVLIPLWAATTWWFLRSLETRRTGWAVLTGIGAAASMLGKYWSIFLLAGLGLAALIDSRRRAYFRSPAPWLTIAVGILLVAPHIASVIANNFLPFHYAMAVHRATFATAAKSSLEFIAGSLSYIAAPIILSLLAARPSFSAVGDTLCPVEPDRRTISVAFAAPLLLAAVAAVPLQVSIASLWSMPAMTLVPIVLLSSELVAIPRDVAVRVLALAIGFPLLMVAVSPVVAIVIHRVGLKDYASDYRLIARAVEGAWYERTETPLRLVGSYPNLVNGIIFYFSDRPSTFAITAPILTPWVNENRIRREGIAIVCPKPELSCVQAMNAYAARYPSAKSEDIVLARRYFGTFDTPVRYEMVIIPPRGR